MASATALITRLPQHGSIGHHLPGDVAFEDPARPNPKPRIPWPSLWSNAGSSAATELAARADGTGVPNLHQFFGANLLVAGFWAILPSAGGRTDCAGVRWPSSGTTGDAGGLF